MSQQLIIDFEIQYLKHCTNFNLKKLGRCKNVNKNSNDLQFS